MRSRAVDGRRSLPVVALLALAVVACTDGTESSGPTVIARSSSPTPASPCPNPEGGDCLGRLSPDTTYSTVRFQPTITYAVPTDGWSNYEDLTGNFLLVPPRNDLAGVNAGTSDYIGVFRSVLPSRLTGPVCGAEWPLGRASGPTPAQMVHYYRGQPNLVVSNVHDTEVGGRTGVVLDIEAAPGVPLDHCREGTTKVAVNSVISGVDGSSFDHGVIRDMTMRLYLLEDGGRVIGIEVTDVHAAPGTADGMSQVAESLRFAGAG